MAKAQSVKKVAENCVSHVEWVCEHLKNGGELMLIDCNGQRIKIPIEHIISKKKEEGRGKDKQFSSKRPKKIPRMKDRRKKSQIQYV